MTISFKRNIILTMLGLTLIAIYPSAKAQNKMDLDDLEIKGELHDDNRLKMLAREKNSLKNHVKFRTNYRKEILEGLMKPEPKYKY